MSPKHAWDKEREVDKCRPEVASDVISGVAVDWVSLDVSAKFGDSTLNSGRIIRLLGCQEPLHALLCSVYLHLSADWKQLVMSYPGGLRGQLPPISPRPPISV